MILCINICDSILRCELQIYQTTSTRGLKWLLRQLFSEHRCISIKQKTMDLIGTVCLALSLSLSLCFSLFFFLLWILIKTVRDLSWIKYCLSQCQLDGRQYLDDARISKAAATIDDFRGPQLEWAQSTCIAEREEQVSIHVYYNTKKQNVDKSAL